MRVEINKHIVMDSKICHGEPTFKDTRVMVWQVLHLLGAGVSADEIIRDYFPRLTKGAVSSAINYASKLVEEEKYVLFS